ncbi:hypothetical protein P7C73_g6475, partial [Tremellales sp. Uapishka_1]
MSQRRGRNSIGSSIQSTSIIPRDATLSQVQQFEDFRRRHARQNKELVSDNVIKKSELKALKKEVIELKTELMEVQSSRNAAVAELKRLQGRIGRMRGDVSCSKWPDREETADAGQSTEALDLIIMAIPALRQLRDVLNIASPPVSKRSRSRPVMGPTFNPIATRPAAAGAEGIGLGAVSEGSECESEPRRRRRHSGMASVAARPRSPAVAVGGFSWTSPSSSFSPTPSPSPPRQHITPRRRSTSEKVQKRRRESGLLFSMTREETPESTVEAEEEAQGDDEVQRDATDGSTLPALETGLEALTVRKKRKGKERAVAEDQIEAAVKVKGKRKERVGREVEAMEIELEGGGENQVLRLPVQELSVVQEDDGSEGSRQSRVSEVTEHEDDGGRHRRARASVNYKEPSLTKFVWPVWAESDRWLTVGCSQRKMRKPEGSEDGKPKSARSSSASSATTTSDRMDHRPAPQMRRKSILPKSSRAKGPPSESEGEGEGEDAQNLPLSASESEEELEEGDSQQTIRPVRNGSPRAMVDTTVPHPKAPSGQFVPLRHRSALADLPSDLGNVRKVEKGVNKTERERKTGRRSNVVV